MRAFAIVLVVVSCSLLALMAAGLYQLRRFAEQPQGVEGPPMTTPTPPELEPGRLHVATPGRGGWTRLMSWEPAASGEPGTCGEAYHRETDSSAPDAGRSTVTLEMTPNPNQDITITDVRIRFTGTMPRKPTPHYLVHCEGASDHQPLVVRAEGRVGEVVSAGMAARKVPLDGIRQDIAVEVTGAETAIWQLEADFTLDGVARTKVISTGTDMRSLMTEPTPADVAGHFVWCDRAFRAGERC